MGCALCAESGARDKPEDDFHETGRDSEERTLPEEYRKGLVVLQRVIDVVLNDESKGETPAIVCFGEKQRFIGTVGDSSSLMNPKNAISQIKRLIGKQFRDPEVQRDLQSLPFTVDEGPDHLQYRYAPSVVNQRRGDSGRKDRPAGVSSFVEPGGKLYANDRDRPDMCL